MEARFERQAWSFHLQSFRSHVTASAQTERTCFDRRLPPLSNTFLNVSVDTDSEPEEEWPEPMYRQGSSRRSSSAPALPYSLLEPLMLEQEEHQHQLHSGKVHGTSLLHSKASIEVASNSTAEELSRSESGSSSEELGGASSLSAQTNDEAETEDTMVLCSSGTKLLAPVAPPPGLFSSTVDNWPAHERAASGGEENEDYICGATAAAEPRSSEWRRQRGVVGRRRDSVNGAGSLSDRIIAQKKLTTLMLQNLPTNLSQSGLRAELDDAGLKGAYDYVHVPRNIRPGASGHGYAFVNFVSVDAALVCFRSWHGVSRFGHYSMPGGYPIKVTAARVQGLQALLNQPALRRLRHVRNPEFFPYIAQSQRGTEPTED